MPSSESSHHYPTIHKYHPLVNLTYQSNIYLTKYIKKIDTTYEPSTQALLQQTEDLSLWGPSQAKGKLPSQIIVPCTGNAK